MKIPIEHLFKKNKYCSDWCARKFDPDSETYQSEATLINNRNMKTWQKYRHKLYEFFKDTMTSEYVIFNRKMLEMCHHLYETQVNDIINNIIAMLAQKWKTYSKEKSLETVS